MRKCFAMDDAWLKELSYGGYFKELLARIRAIRASEKVFYRQVLEIYATSIDYDPRSVISCSTDSSRIGRSSVRRAASAIAASCPVSAAKGETAPFDWLCSSASDSGIQGGADG